MTFYKLEEAEEIGNSLGLLALKFMKYTPEQKCITLSCICFLCILPYYFIYYSLTRTPTNLRLSL